MVSLNTIRDEFARKLAIKPHGLSMEEFRNIAEMLLQSITPEDQELFTRFDYWMRHSDRSAQIICANIELVRFEVLSARPQQKSKKSDSKNSDSYRSLSLAQEDNLFKFLGSCLIEPLIIRRLPETVETRAQLIDKWIAEQIDSKKRIDLLDDENITEETNNGNKRTQSMSYISYEDLVRCISRSKNASSLRDYAMQLMAVFKIYSEELIIAKDNAIDEKNNKIDELNETMNHIKTQNETLIAKIDTQSADIQQLLRYGKSADQKLDDLGEKFDRMFSFLLEFAKLILPAWIGSSVLRTRMTGLIETYAEGALFHIKLAFMVGLTDGNTLRVLFCCTNIANVHRRINDICTHRNSKYHMTKMLHPRAISLMNEDIGKELAVLRNLDMNFHDRTKSFSIELGNSDITIEYDRIVNTVRARRLQAYQEHMDTMRTNTKTSTTLISRVRSVDNQFYSSTLNAAQDFLNCFIYNSTASYRYQIYRKNLIMREDLNDVMLNDRDYSLERIRLLIDTDDVGPLIYQLAKDGILDEDARDVFTEIA